MVETQIMLLITCNINRGMSYEQTKSYCYMYSIRQTYAVWNVKTSRIDPEFFGIPFTMPSEVEAWSIRTIPVGVVVGTCVGAELVFWVGRAVGVWVGTEVGTGTYNIGEAAGMEWK